VCAGELVSSAKLRRGNIDRDQEFELVEEDSKSKPLKRLKNLHQKESVATDRGRATVVVRLAMGRYGTSYLNLDRRISVQERRIDLIHWI